MAENIDKNIELDENLVKALETVLSKAEFDEFMKGRKAAENKDTKKEKEDTEDQETEEEKLEKAWGLAKAEYDEMKKSYKAKKTESGIKGLKKGLKMKKSELMKAFPTKFTEEKKEEKEDVKKSTEVDIVKSFGEALDIKLKGLTEANDNLVKSFDLVKSENAELKKSIETMAAQRPGLKSVKHTILEKGSKDNLGIEDGKTILSVSQNKGLVETVLDEAMEKAESPDIKKAIGECLMNYNSGGAPISQEIASYLYTKHNTKLVG